ncbi:HNH endonuclease [uncultured Acinetobacter sp.]|uniref:HNH endonuclease n=1 Tax=uncultured Acinetobacter sp. TaxID=165433 RepID=UPI0037489F4C
MNKSNLAHKTTELQESRQCHLCGVVDDYTSYFQSKYEQLICFECMSDHSEWYLTHISKIYVESKRSERLEKMLPSSSGGYKKKRISQTLRMQVYERDGFACVTCGVQKNLSLDHIKPEVLGGESTLENLQTMCKSCNSRKGARYDEAPN